MKTISYDFQGWPVKAMTLREILLALGFEEDTETLTLIKSEETMKLLDSYPRILEDDGMAYGIDNGFITEVSDDVYPFERESTGQEERVKRYEIMKDENVFNVFIEQPFMTEENIQMEKEMEELIKNKKNEK